MKDEHPVIVMWPYVGAMINAMSKRKLPDEAFCILADMLGTKIVIRMRWCTHVTWPADYERRLQHINMARLNYYPFQE